MHFGKLVTIALMAFTPAADIVMPKKETIGGAAEGEAGVEPEADDPGDEGAEPPDEPPEQVLSEVQRLP